MARGIYTGATFTENIPTTTGLTNNYIFIDEYGNVTQIQKKAKNRYEYYIDPDLSNVLSTTYQWIGMNSGIKTDDGIELGVALGFGDIIMCLSNYPTTT